MNFWFGISSEGDEGTRAAPSKFEPRLFMLHIDHVYRAAMTERAWPDGEMGC